MQSTVSARDLATTADQAQRGEQARPPRRRGRGLGIVIAATCVVACIAALGLIRVRADTGPNRRGNAAELVLPPVLAGDPTSFDTEESVPPAAAATPVDAVRRFLDAEIADAFVLSFGRLSAADRAAFEAADVWADRLDQHPGYVSYAVISDEPDGRVVVEAQLSPLLSEVEGIVPAQARIVFATVAEDGGYRLDSSATTMEARYPDRDAAELVARAWLVAALGCDAQAAAAQQYEGTLLGRFGVVPSLCGATGVPVISEIGDIALVADASPLFAAFGENVGDWTAVVRFAGLTGQPSLSVALAPLGDRWVVIGAF
jgi:hypothetical protein